jgi:hypothetical protein
MSTHVDADHRPADPIGAPAGRGGASRDTVGGQPREGGGPGGAGGESLSGTAILAAWAISILAHVFLFTVMFLVPWLSGVVGPYDELPIAETDLVSHVRPEAEWKPTPDAMPRTTVVREDPVAFKPREFEMMTEVPGTRRPDLKIIGIGTGGGDASKFGLQLGATQAGPTFFGIGSKARGARRIVYVVDRSGSMMDTIGAVQKELKRSINALRRSQRFHIIFYNAGEPLENPPKRLVSAARVHKEEADRFIDSVQAQGQTNPLQAVRRAFAVKPDLIYFLSDGEIPVAKELLTLLDELNSRREVRIFTIAYVNLRGAELLETIAREHNGEYRYVSENDLFD